jgi:hypothetical protein
LANTQRPPPPVLDAPAEGDELGELSESLDAGAAQRERVSDIEALAPALVTPGRPSAHGIPRGSEHERLDLAALSKETLAAPPAPRVSFDDDEPHVLPQARKPRGALLLLLGFGAGVAVSVVMFSVSHRDTVNAAHAPAAVTKPAMPAAAAPALAAPAATEQEPAAVQAKVAATTHSAPASPAGAMVAIAPRAAPTHAATRPAEVTNGVARNQPLAMASPVLPPSAPAFASRDESPAEPTAPAAPTTPVLVVRPAAEPEPTAEPASPKRGSLDTLLDNALSPEARAAELAREQRPPAQPQPAPSQQPSETPSRSEVAQAMSGLQRAIVGCAMGQKGVAQAVLTVRNDGSVVTAEITNAPFAGTASGRCMEGALRSAHFARFSKPLFSVRYPFSIE